MTVEAPAILKAEASDVTSRPGWKRKPVHLLQGERTVGQADTALSWAFPQSAVAGDVQEFSSGSAQAGAQRTRAAQKK